MAANQLGFEKNLGNKRELHQYFRSRGEIMSESFIKEFVSTKTHATAYNARGLYSKGV